MVAGGGGGSGGVVVVKGPIRSSLSSQHKHVLHSVHIANSPGMSVSFFSFSVFPSFFLSFYFFLPKERREEQKEERYGRRKSKGRTGK